MKNTTYTYVMKRRTTGEYLVGRNSANGRANVTNDLAKAIHRHTEKEARKVAFTEIGLNVKHFDPVKVVHTLSEVV